MRINARCLDRPRWRCWRPVRGIPYITITIAAANLKILEHGRRKQERVPRLCRRSPTVSDGRQATVVFSSQATVVFSAFATTHAGHTRHTILPDSRLAALCIY